MDSPSPSGSPTPTVSAMRHSIPRNHFDFVYLFIMFGEINGLFRASTSLNLQTGDTFVGDIVMGQSKDEE